MFNGAPWKIAVTVSHKLSTFLWRFDSSSRVRLESFADGENQRFTFRGITTAV